MKWGKLPDGREYLPEGTLIRFEYQSRCYKILGTPIGYGGAGILYPAIHVIQKEDRWEEDGIRVAVKECFPNSTDGVLTRNDSGEICCVREGDTESSEYYAGAKKMMRQEKRIAGQIFNRGFRLTPIWEIAEQEEISLDGKEFQKAENQYGIMERLDEKGISLGQILKEQPGGCLTAYQSICILEQVLLALMEVHDAGYLHGDIQENNIFLKGTDFARNEEGMATLIDFGSARELQKDGATAMIRDRNLFSTPGYSAPECITGNDGTLRLTKAADIYSVGYLMLRMIVGKNMDARGLQLVMNGKYLYPRQARKIGCPSGSIAMVNKILSKALERQPQDRYRSGEEMLEELRRLKQTLAPKKSAIASVDYEAFISYCHEEISIQAAEQIQKMIERYHIPKAVQKLSGKTKMGRVFRDREELASVSDMEVHLKEALAHSEYLILLLSPGAAQSPWVKREIELFLQTHDRDHILTILVDGELRESFPEYLRMGEKYDSSQIKMVPVESLAADIRGVDKKERKRRLKTEIFRLLAPMLGCSYDDLRQRQKEYRSQKILKVSLTAACLSGIIAVFVGWQALQIQKNYRETLVRQSRYLAEVSSQLLEKGDRIKALQTAMEALPESSRDRSRPRTPEAEAALANALYAYQGVDAIAHAVHADYLVEMESRAGEIRELSSDGAWLLSEDMEGTIYIWNTADGSLKRKWDEKFLRQKGIDSTIAYGTFLGEDRVFLLTGSSLVQMNIETEEILVQKQLTETISPDTKGAEHLQDAMPGYCSFAYRLCAMNPEKSILAAYDQSKGYLAVFDVESGSLIYLRKLDDRLRESMASPEVNDLAISPDGRYVALAAGELWGLVQEEKDAGLLVMADTREDVIHTAASETCGYYRCCFDQENKLASYCYAPYTVLFDSLKTECPGKVECFDPKKGEQTWELEFTCLTGNEQNFGIIPDEEEDRFLVWYDRQLQILDGESGEVLRSGRCDRDIIGVFCRRANNYLVVNEDAGMYLLGGDQIFVKLGTNVTRETESFLFDNENFSAYLFSDDGAIAAMHKLPDPGMKRVELEREIYAATTYPEGNDFYSVSSYGNEEQTATTETFYHSGTDEKWFELELDGIPAQSVILKDGKTCCCVEYVETKNEEGFSEYTTFLLGYDMEKQEELWRTESRISWGNITLVQTGRGEELAVCVDGSGAAVLFLDLKTGKWLEEELISGESSPDVPDVFSSEAYLTESGEYLVWKGKNYDENSAGYRLLVYNRKEKAWVELSEEIQNLKVSFEVEFAENKPWAAVYEEAEKQIIIVDLEKNCIRKRIPFHGKDYCRYRFVKEDSALLLWSYGGSLTLWDLEKDDTVMEDTRKFIGLTFSYLEDGEPLMLIRGTDEESADLVLNGMWMNWIYLLENDRFYPYVQIFNGVYDKNTKRIGEIGETRNSICWFEQYSLDELLEWGREVVGDKKLSEADKVKYIIES